MRVTRRRFLTIAAAMAATPGIAATSSWNGSAFGANVSLTLNGSPSAIEAALDRVPKLLSDIERLFSLYDPRSDLSRLNGTGLLSNPDPRFVMLMEAADVGHELTDGLFEPTIQPLWKAAAEGEDTNHALATVGWHRVQFDRHHIQLAPDQALTFNGIAQGYATDLVRDLLNALGFQNALVNMGEHAAIGGPWRLGLSDPVHGLLGQRTLTDTAIATSSPTAMALNGQAHILHPFHKPMWSTVSVEAKSATLADCLSTALCFASRDKVMRISAAADVERIMLVDADGNLTSL